MTVSLLAPKRWTQDGDAAERDGVVGGDGACDSWSRRWHRDNGDGTYGVITTYYYPFSIRDRNGEDTEDADLFDVENMTMYAVCTDLDDVGGSETWSDVDYDYPDSIAQPDLESADKRSKQLCADETLWLYTWNGQPFHR